MKILKNAGKFKILSRPEDVIRQIAAPTRECYNSSCRDSPEANMNLVRQVIAKGHHAMLEHASITVRFSNTSRGNSHELVRHRLCSFAQRSTRYVDDGDFAVVVPPHMDENEKCIELYQVTDPVDFEGKTITAASTLNISLKEWLVLNEQAYRSLRENGWKKEDARQVLPIAIEAPIVVTANIREWRHIFKMRCDYFAHWEIRKIMLDLLRAFQKEIPLVFDDFDFFIHDEKKFEYAAIVLPLGKLKIELKHYIRSGSLLEYNNKISKMQEYLEGMKMIARPYPDV